LNRVILIGRLTADPEVRYTPNGVPVASLRIAVDRPQSTESRAQGQEKQTDFIDLTAWRQSAEFAGKYLGKGRLIAVEGKLQIDEYQAQDGTRRKAAKVVCDNIRPLGLVFINLKLTFDCNQATFTKILPGKFS